MAREAYGLPFSALCEADLSTVRNEVKSAINVLESNRQYTYATSVEYLLQLADDMIEYLKKEDH